MGLVGVGGGVRGQAMLTTPGWPSIVKFSEALGGQCKQGDVMAFGVVPAFPELGVMEAKVFSHDCGRK